MPALLPPLRLTGALTLRDGQMQPRTVAIAGGRITTGPLPEVDLSGYYILPGIVDVHASGFQSHLMPERSHLGGGLAQADQEAAMHGVTTRYLSQPWSWERPSRSPETAERLAGLWSDYRHNALTDLRLQLCCDTHLVAEEDRLLDLVQRHRIDQVIFSGAATKAREMRWHDPIKFGQWCWQHGSSSEQMSAALDGVLADAARVPRHLCRLAEQFDQLGTLYGSYGDPSAETREHFSMIGARICIDPETTRVAAAAKAVSDPLVLSADGILCPHDARKPIDAISLVRNGTCDVLASGNHSASLVQAAFRLVDLGVMTLPAAWRLVSSAPAELMRLPDRGVIEAGKRADLVVINAGTRMVEATISAGRPTYLAGAAAARFLGAAVTCHLAAE